MAHAAAAELVGEYHLHTYFFQSNDASRAEALAFRCVGALMRSLFRLGQCAFAV